MPQIPYQQLEKHLSPPRFGRYLTAASNHKTKAKRLYKANLRVAQAFHPLLSLLEVALRNGLNSVLTVKFGDPDWIINQQRGFMSDPSLRHGNFFLRKEAEKASNRLTRKRVIVTSGKIIAEQTFGFWTEFFEPHHYRLVGGCPIRIFAHLPSHIKRRNVANQLAKIRLFRNRISHNEPVCFIINRVDFTPAEEVHDAILSILQWLEPGFAVWVNDLDSVKQEIHKAQAL
jgi:hypothetical protein